MLQCRCVTRQSLLPPRGQGPWSYNPPRLTMRRPRPLKNAIEASHIDSAAIKTHMIVFLLLGSRRRISRTRRLPYSGVYMCVASQKQSRACGVDGVLKKQKRIHSCGYLGTRSTHALTGCIDSQWMSSGSSHLVTLQLTLGHRRACWRPKMDGDHTDRGIGAVSPILHG